LAGLLTIRRSAFFGVGNSLAAEFVRLNRTAFHDLRSLVLLAPRTDLAEPIHGTDRNGQGKGEHARRWNEALE
jgi:hypothetical protein